MQSLKIKREFQSANFEKDISEKKKLHTRSLYIPSLLFPALVIFRVINAILIRTTFVPDETWQSIEVAHFWTFGYGALTWEWLPTTAIRSPLHPLLLASIYKLLAAIGLDSRFAITTFPRLFHGIFAALTDYNLYILTFQLVGGKCAKWVLTSQLLNWFTAYCGPRCLANSIEWTLTTVAFRYYTRMYLPTEYGRNPWRFILAVCVCCILRPTAALIWAPVCLNHLVSEISSHHRFLIRLFLYACIAFPCLAVSAVVDYEVYGRWTLNQWNFIRFNLLSTGANFYGVESWHWYLSNGLPVMLLLQLPISIFGFLMDVFSSHRVFGGLLFEHTLSSKELQLNRSLAYLFGSIVAWNVLIYSVLAHKEYRFIFPILPLFMFYCGRGLVHLSTMRLRRRPNRFSPLSGLYRWLLVLLVLSNVPVALYTCLIHQRGPNALMEILGRRGDSAQWASLPEDTFSSFGIVGSSEPEKRQGFVSVLCLMPCHTTPHLSHLHRNISFRLLSCDPELSAWTGSSLQSYVDEADVFYDNPTQWLNVTFSSWKETDLPQYISVFDHLINTPTIGSGVTHFLHLHEYSVCASIFHSHFPVHRRHSKYILVYCKRGWVL